MPAAARERAPAHTRGTRGGFAASFALLLALAPPALAQPNASPGGELDFGVELELRAREVTPRRVRERSFADYVRALEPIVRAYGGDPSEVRRVDFTKPGSQRKLMRAEWTDRQGRTWRVEPEWVTGGGRQQVDFELVTPRLSDPSEIERVVRAVGANDQLREGLQSSVHIHVDGKGLVGPGGDATALINLINLHETLEPQLRRLFSPVRGAGIFNGAAPGTGPEGAYVNRFNRPLYLDHPELLEELSKLPPAERTRARVEALFAARAEAEARVHGETALGTKGWKYRSLNLANLLELNPNLPASKGSVEFRMNDLDLRDPAAHKLQVELYRALVAKAKELAARGEVVPAPKRGPLPAGADPAIYFGEADPALARAELRSVLGELGLDPKAYEGLLQRNVRAPPAFDAASFSERLESLRLGAGDRLALAGEAGAARTPREVLEGLRSAPVRPDLILRLPAPGDPARALSVAEALAKRANAALYLSDVAHAGAQSGLTPREVVRARLVGSEVEFRIAPGQRSLTQLDQLTRLLSRGVGAVDPPRGSKAGLPAQPSALAEAAAAYADQAEGRRLSAKARRALEVLSQRGGPQLSLPLLAWAGEDYLSRAEARDLRFRQERYLSELIGIAEGISASTGGYERALERARTLVRDWTNQTRLAEVLFRSLLPNHARPNDALARYRRADGTLKWRELTRERALQEGAGLAHFGLALFLKEVAVVVSTGDRARIEEFFDGLMTTDFYKHYGLFVAGARVGEVAYVRYLQRYVRPQFVNGLLKTNLTLAAGLALPMIVEGTFEGRTFAVSLGSLGLSSAAVQAGVRSIRWVASLKQARETGALARVGLKGSRLAKVGGWFYTAAELAVVLYFAEKIETEVNAYLDREAAKEELSQAGIRFLAALNAEDVSPASVKAAGEDYHEAWIAYRDFLYGPLHVDEATFAQRLEGLARRAKIDADKRQAAIERIAAHPALKARMIARYGSLEAYAESLVADDERDMEATVNTYLESYERSRKEHLDAVYFDNRRSGGLLDDLEERDWLLGGARAGAEGDPWGKRSDPWASWGRSRARGSLEDALGSVGSNRLQAYEDEAALFGRLESLARERGQGEIAAELGRRREVALALLRADEALVKGDGLITAPSAPARGIVDALRDSR